MKKFLLIALVAVLVVSGGMFAATFTTATGTISVAEPAGDVATCNATPTQPDWDSILDDLASENKTRGEVPAGDLFTITPDNAYTGDLVANVYLANAGDLTKAYSHLNMKLYAEGSSEAEETPNYRMVTLQNGEATFALEEMAAASGTWTQTSQAEFEAGTLYQVDTTTSPGDVMLDIFADDVTDTFADETMIAASANVTVSGSQVKLSTTGAASDNETLRPDAAGDNTSISDQFPVTGEHWDKVYEETSDGDTTYVSTTKNWEEDLYSTANHTAGSGDINYVKVYMVARATATPSQTNAYIHIKTNGVQYNSPEITTTSSYAAYSYQWNNNPQTSQAWTWDEIDALQIGAGIRVPKPNKETRVTQVYAEVNYTSYTYHPTGTVTSINLLSAETVISIDSFDYYASAIPSGTGLNVQFSTDNTNWYNSAGAGGGWDTLSQGTHSIDLSGLGWSGPNFYYHMLFTSDGSDTPILDEISVIFSTYYASGTLTSSAFDSGYDSDWGNISFTVNEPSGTDIKFQIRTAATEGGLSSATWYGPTSTTDYYQISGAAVNPIHDGDRWIQYKAYFAGPGDITPTLSDVSITYYAEAVAYTIKVIGGGYCLVSDNASEWGEGWTITPEFYCEAEHR